MSELVRGVTPKESWAAVAVVDRLRIIRRLRRAVAADPRPLARTLADRRPLAETLSAEVLPLLDAARFLERRAVSLLCPRRLGRRSRPAWLWGVSAELRREPCGTVLILAPGNYPLFLPGVQVLQALAAGNAVVVKPAPGCAAPMRFLGTTLEEAGLPAGLLTVLADTAEAGIQAVEAGADRIVLTGSAATGRRVLAAAAERLTPCTMELSGSDPVFVLRGADLDLTARALAYGLRLNGGATCIAPRKVFIHSEAAAGLERRLAAHLADAPAIPVPPPVLARLRPLLDEARAAGARVSCWPEASAARPIVVADARPGLGLLLEELLAPVLSIVPVPDDEAELAAAAACPYALGAAVFGPPDAASRFAARIRAGSVVINDLIVPTADPRLPFGGRGESGFGLTRGAEGLLEMTVCKTVLLRRGSFRPHLDARADDDGALTALIGALHGAPSRRLSAFRGLIGRRSLR